MFKNFFLPLFALLLLAIQAAAPYDYRQGKKPVEIRQTFTTTATNTTPTPTRVSVRTTDHYPCEPTCHRPHRGHGHCHRQGCGRHHRHHGHHHHQHHRHHQHVMQ